MKFNDLQSWLSWQESLHLTEIELGLERIRKVADQLQIPARWQIPVITVAGTNGKGSSVATLESIYHAAGYKVGSYTSPHLLRYNERIRLQREAVEDALIVAAFDQVETARLAAGGISLTYFEFGTLAALLILLQAEIDVAVLEVGLGGRLDAVNIIDADIALITPVALDHQGWLGDTREQIAAEKAGIIKSVSTVVCSDPEPAQAIYDRVADLKIELFCLNEDFSIRQKDSAFSFRNTQVEINHLPAPALAGQYQFNNVAACIEVVQLLQNRLAVNDEAIRSGVADIKLAGRFQLIKTDPLIIIDVAHNPHAITALTENLQNQTCHGRTLAVVAMLEDKAICEALIQIDPVIDQYYLAGLSGSRALNQQQLVERVQECLSSDKLCSDVDVAAAMSRALAAANSDDRIIVFGSFITVAAAMNYLQNS